MSEIGAGTYVDDPRLDGTEEEIILVVGLADLVPVVNHPAKLDRREIGRERQTGATHKSIPVKSVSVSECE